MQHSGQTSCGLQTEERRVVVVFEGQDVLADLANEPERSVVLVLLLYRHCEPERRPVPSFDCRCDESPQLERLQLVLPGSFKDGYVDVEVSDLLVDRVFVLLEPSCLELGLCIVASIRRHIQANTFA